MGLLLLYFIVLMRLTQNAQTAPDRAGTFVVMGVVAVLSFHILVNVGMVVGFMPVTGIPLPLMSYGGSSVLFMFLALGMVMNVRMRRFRELIHGNPVVTAAPGRSAAVKDRKLRSPSRKRGAISPARSTVRAGQD